MLSRRLNRNRTRRAVGYGQATRPRARPTLKPRTDLSEQSGYNNELQTRKNRASARRRKIRLIHFDKHVPGLVAEYLGFSFNPDTIVSNLPVTSTENEPGFEPLRILSKRDQILHRSATANDVDIQLTRALPFSVFSLDLGVYCYDNMPIQIIGTYAKGGDVKTTIIVNATEPKKVTLKQFTNLSGIHIREDMDPDLQAAKTPHVDSLAQSNSFGVTNILIKLTSERNLVWPETDGDFRTADY